MGLNFTGIGLIDFNKNLFNVGSLIHISVVSLFGRDTVVRDKLYGSPRYLTSVLITESEVLKAYNVKKLFKII